jgi:hypothetical protein
MKLSGNVIFKAARSQSEREEGQVFPSAPDRAPGGRFFPGVMSAATEKLSALHGRGKTSSAGSTR